MEERTDYSFFRWFAVACRHSLFSLPFGVIDRL